MRQSWRKAVVALAAFAVCIQLFWSVQSSPVHSPVQSRVQVLQRPSCEGKYYLLESISGFWILDSGIWNLDSGFWILESGIWILDSGFWNLLDKHMHSRQRAQMLASYPGLRLLTPAFVPCNTKPLAEMEELEEVGLFILGVRRFTLKGCIFPNWELYLVRRVCD